jgi:hypothetical protein
MDISSQARTRARLDSHLCRSWNYGWIDRVRPKRRSLFPSHPNVSWFQQNFQRPNATGIGILATPASLYALGLIRRDSKMQHTALLATESLIDAGILTTVLKDVTNRIAPDRIRTGGNYSDGWFKRAAARS